MVLTKRELVQVVWQATGLYGRLDAARLAHSDDGDAELIQSRMKQWRRSIGADDDEAFARRLALDGLDLDTARHLLADDRLVTIPEIPVWAGILDDALERYTEPLTQSPANNAYPPLIHPHAHLPFEELLLPFIDVARSRLRQQAEQRYALLEQSAHNFMERSLLFNLAQICTPSAELEFSLFRLPRQSSFSRLVGKQQSRPSTGLYEDFIAFMRDGGMKTFFLEYAVLGRLIGSMVQAWIEATAEFIARLAEDLDAITAAFAPGREVGTVQAVAYGLSDPHNGGRTVIALTFTSGLKLVYKPKDLGLEAAYGGLLAWLNERGVSLPFKVVRVLERSSHGWVEFVAHAPCQDAAAAQRFYRRSGMLLSLLYVLECTDCNLENIIACGEHPMLIDMETLLHPRIKDADAAGTEQHAVALATGQIAESVLRVGLLPQWKFGVDGQSFDSSALGGAANQVTDIRVPKWESVNTDSMSLEYTFGVTRSHANLPALDGTALSPMAYADEILDGFREMYTFLMVHRAELLGDDGPLSAFHGLTGRFVYRGTQRYGDLQRKLLHPDYLRDGIDRGIQLDRLSRRLLAGDVPERLWPILHEEIRALERMDVPFFAVRSDLDSLVISDGQGIPHFFEEPSFSRVRRRLMDLHSADLDQQVSIARAAMGARIATQPHVEVLPESVNAPRETQAPVALDQAIRAARQIAEELKRHAIVSEDGSVTWLTLRYLTTSQRYQLQPMGYDLYDGSCGVALFLAALYEVTGDGQYLEFLRGVLQPVWRFLTKAETAGELVAHLGIGGVNGLASIVYALARIGRFLDSPDYLARAAHAADLLGSELVDADRQFDLVTGNAGALLGLLALYRATGDATVLEKARRCGTALVRQRSETLPGPRAWQNAQGKHLCGFSHGAVGIAYALLQLAIVSGETTYLDAAEEALAYVHALYSAERRNWPDFRSEPPSYRNISWCHGATGVGMGLLGVLPAINNRAVRDGVEAALTTMRAVGLGGQDHLCCGNFGRIDFAFSASQSLSRPELGDWAAGYAATVLQRAEQTGSFVLFANLPRGIYHPAFFQGTSGIGYQLLRMHFPEQFPSVLLLA